ncbi:MAG: cation transporter [Candidatus Lokiarchaeota archaeon]|nr:cation transporter [Candidatus Lokiarchaeota archaeon]
MVLSDLKARYSLKDLKKGPNREKMALYKEFFKHHSEPHTGYFYGFLAFIYDGINTIDSLKANMKHIFISSTNQLVVESQDVEEFLQTAKNQDLVSIDQNGLIKLTKRGKDLVELCYLNNLHASHWMRLFFSEKTAMLGTAIVLIILSLLKIITGLQLGSSAMLNEGMENLTDLIKIGLIIVFCFKLKKDKLASMIITILMLITGISLLWSAIESLLNISQIIPTIQAYLISIFSIVMNAGLMFLKSMVGRISGNLSLLSDSKDSQINIYISLGVLIGLTFSIFKYYFVDAIVGIVISIVIFKEGVELLRELIKKEKEFDITEIKVIADHVYHNRLSGYLFANIRRESLDRNQLLNNFKQGLELGKLYYEGFADFFYENLGELVAEKHLNKLIEGGNIKETNAQLSLTQKGLKYLYKAKAKEFTSRARHIYERASIRRSNVFCLLIIVIFVFILIFANDINTLISSF